MTPAELRQRRIELGLSRSALAGALGVSTNTVGRWERDDAVIRPSRLISLALHQLELDAASVRPPPQESSHRHRPGRARRHHNLPAPTSTFVGRRVERAQIGELVREKRLVTLVGTGGVGKTRLAREIAADLLKDFRDGAWLVDLAPLATPDLVAHAAAGVLGVRESPLRGIVEHLGHALRRRHALLILDNCEHVRGGCADLAAVFLSAAPGVHILATSREPLQVPGETVWRVAPLSVPQEVGPSAASLPTSEAVSLFVERAASVRPGFTLTAPLAPAVARICQRLDGIPLALELAAARLVVLSVDGLAQRLEHTTEVLRSANHTTTSRQQTLSAAFDWSYSLLSMAERHLFDRLSVFAGGWTLQACQRVWGDDLDAPVLDLLEALVLKSLVTAEEQAGEMRFRLLEPLRQYARHHLRSSGEDDVLHDRHLDAYLALAETAAPQFWRADQLEWYRRVDRDLANIRAALRWSATSDQTRAAKGLRLASALWLYWDLRGYLQEGYGCLVDLLDKAPVPSAARAMALAAAGYLAAMQGDYQGGQALGEQGLALARQIGDGPTLLDTLIMFGLIVGPGGADQPRTSRIWEELLALARPLSSSVHIGASVYWLGELARARGDLQRATELFAQSLRIARELGNTWSTAYSLGSLAQVALHQGQYDTADALYREGLTLRRGIEDARGIPLSLETFAWVAAADKRPRRAARLLGAAAALNKIAGARLPAEWSLDHERAVAAIRAGLSQRAFARAWAAGSAMSMQQALDYALATDNDAGPGGPAESRSRLTRREQQVAELVARGLSNRLIAERLVIAKYTADRHVSHILGKLGVTTRAQVATWVVERERTEPHEPT